MDLTNIIFTISIVVTVLGVAFYYFYRWAMKKTTQQNEMMERYKQNATIFVIDKVRDKASNVNLPKQVQDQLPKVYKFMKMYFVRAKVGPQIHMFICDKRVFEAIPVKKNVKVEMAGIYISSFEGLKSEKEMKEIKKSKKDKEKQKEKEEKKSKK